MELPGTIWQTMLNQSEFWSAIGGVLVGTIVGGLISWVLQSKALSDKRKERVKDLQRSQQVLANSLIIKMIKIYSNFSSINKHLEDSLANPEHIEGNPEPWQIVKPLAILPNPVFFSSEELSMLMSIGNDDVFNAVLPLDTVHNALSDTVQLFQNKQLVLLDQLKVEQIEGAFFKGSLNERQFMAMRLKIKEVNTLIEQTSLQIERGLEESKKALINLHTVLQDELVLTYKLEDCFSSEGFTDRDP